LVIVLGILMGKENKVTEGIARCIAETRYEDIPLDAKEIAKKCILDNLGVIIGGTSQGLGHEKLLNLSERWGGRKESSVFGFGIRVPAHMAAFVNAGLARALDYDDTFDDAPGHPSDVTVPSALAIAEQSGKVSGKDLITAIVLGNDLICRLGYAISRRPQGAPLEWAYNSITGIFGGTAACARLLNLKSYQIEDSLGIALYQTAGTFQARFTPEATIWNMATCFPAMSSVLSANMAASGITGGRETFEGKAGLFRMYFNNEWNREALGADLGRKFEIINISFKPWPGVRYNHSYIDATLQLMRENNITNQDIKKMTLYVAGWVEEFCKPLEKRRKPKTILEAKASLPYLVSVAATKGKVLVGDVIPDGMNNPMVLKFSEKITWEHDDRFNSENKIGPAKVKIEVTNGKFFEKELSVAYGHPQSPISWDDLENKFRDCTSYSVRPKKEEAINTAIDMVRNLEEMDNIGELISKIT